MRPRLVEPALIGYLRGVTSTQVGSRVPEVRPSAWVRVNATGGDRANLVQGVPAVLVECWAASEGAAARLAGDVWAHLDALNTNEALPWVHRVGLTLPVNFPDPDLPTFPRYQFIAAVTSNLEVTP